MKVSELNGDFKGTFSDPPAGTIPGDTAGETISYTIFRESTPDPIGGVVGDAERARRVYSNRVNRNGRRREILGLE